ncbi:hypothetical protein TRVA0_002S03356 [Trichomonascus vanleenenianus]|uniref:uncharacterized protein n=1 Tax=Trichomonascus vanleenenianus TaxID=2268995 RepID=UPI003ECB90EF
MGATDSKLQFKNHIFRLFEEGDIPRRDSYWNKFWEQPESANDIFTLFTASDIRSARDAHVENLETLIIAVASRMFYLYEHSSFPSPDVAPAKEMLNCVRLLTRIMPYIYERRSDDRIAQWEEELFWTKEFIPFNTDIRQTVVIEEDSAPQKPLACLLIETALGLLFYGGFTVPKGSGRSGVIHAIWETGVGSSSPVSSTQEMQSNRIEVLRLLLSLCSDGLYSSPSGLAANGSKYLSYIVTRPDKRSTMALLCSLLNITLKYYPGWKVPYDHMIVSDRYRQLVTYSLQLLEVLLVYAVPSDHIEFIAKLDNSKEDSNGFKNWYRHYLSKLHRIQDLQFIADSLAKLLTQPIQASSSYLPGSRREIEWVSELTMLLWDLVQCNKKFRAYLISSDKALDFSVLLLYYIHEKRQDDNKKALVRLCAYFLLYLSADESYAKALLKKFEGQNALPSAIKVSTFYGSYADYMIIQLVKTIHTSGESLNFMVSTLLEIVYNISPYVKGVSYLAASNLVHLFSTLTSPSFYLANEQNNYLLNLILEIFNSMSRYNFQSNRHLLFALLRHEHVLTKLQEGLSRQAAVSSDDYEPEEEDNEGDDEASVDAAIRRRAKGKEPVREGEENTSERSKLESIEKAQQMWTLLDPLASLVAKLREAIGYQASPTNESVPHAVIESIGKVESLPGVDITPREPTPEEFVAVKFEWTVEALGWYESVLWGAIFQHEYQVGVNLSALSDAAELLSANASSTSVGVWNGTAIKLFRLQETAPTGPSLLRPKGAVDALADTMIERFGRLARRSDE